MKNRYEKRGDHYAIFANGSGMQHEILIDEADFETVAAFSGMWFACKGGNTFYAWIRVRGTSDKWKTVKMHRVLLNPPTELQVDHKNRNGLDNRRENIRIVTNGENGRNRINNVEFQSDMDGVQWHARDKAWHARSWMNGKQTHLGIFDTMIEAEAAVCMFLEIGMRVKRTPPTAEFQSDVLGVSWHTPSQAWRAQPWINGKQIHLGLFDTIPEAHAALLMYQETGKRVKHNGKRRAA